MKWKILDWVVRGLIALTFAMASLGKLTSHPGVVQMFSGFGFPDGFHLLVGAIELAGAVLVLIPATRRIAIIALGIVVTGAAVTHAMFDPLSELFRPLVIGAFLLLAWFLPAKSAGEPATSPG